jgi:endo-1,4-beta-xylanase
MSSDTLFPQSMLAGIKRREALALMAAAPLCGCSRHHEECVPPADQAGWGKLAPPQTGSAAQIASSKGMFIGTGLMADPLRKDPDYGTLIADTCNFWVHGSALQWHELQPLLSAPYDFRSADMIYDWGKSHNLPARGHMLIDWNRLPPGLDNAVDAATPAEAEAMLRAHVDALTTHFRGKFLQWNVVNEPIGGGGVRKLAWFKKLGEQYIDMAFDAAAKGDPGVQLSINQATVEMKVGWQRHNQDLLLKLVQRLKGRGVPIGAVGIEGHLTSGWCVDQHGVDMMAKELAKMDIAFFVSELDVDDHAFPADPAKRDADVASLTRDFLDVTLSQPNCQGLVCWGLDDRYNWIPLAGEHAREDGTRQRPAPFDDQFRPKQMWHQIVYALANAPGPGAMSIMPKA